MYKKTLDSSSIVKEEEILNGENDCVLNDGTKILFRLHNDVAAKKDCIFEWWHWCVFETHSDVALLYSLANKVYVSKQWIHVSTNQSFFVFFILSFNLP